MASPSPNDPTTPDPPQSVSVPETMAMPVSKAAARLHLRASDILENVSDAFVALDRDWRILYANHEACRINQKPLAEFVGRVHWEEWPAAVGSEIERHLRHVMEERVAAHFETRYVSAPYDVWLENDVYPSEDGINLFYRDITARHRAEETLRESEIRFRALADNIAQLAWMADGTGSIFWYNRRWFDYTGTTLEEMRGWGWQKVHDPALVDGITAKFAEHVRDGRAWEDTFPLRGADGVYRWFLSRAFPTRDASGAVALWCGTNTDVTEQREAEAKLATAYRREALLNRIGHALRDSLDPDLIQERAAALLGEALGAERCYFSVYHPQRDAVRISRDWHRPGLPSVAGEYRLGEYRGYVDALYANGTAAIADAQAPDVPADVRRVLGGFGIRAFLAVPLFDGGRFAAALAASMSSGPRVWTPDEIALMEAALTQTRMAVEEARLRLREHRIAEQLQAALQPPTPASVPGLALADYYRPALEDEGVGGDFSDVFSADKGVTFLIVGDLSGKGLAAASQVATVRHMLRFALLNGRSVAGPVTSLSRTLAGHDLLTGFATLFVGRYDAGLRALTYVNCGQDAGLLLRAAGGRAEPLPPTGPVLGISAGAEYQEHTVTLAPGDVLALYTDGLSEAGPTRASLLTGDGVADLLEQQTGQADPRIIVEGIIAGVDAHAQHGIRDDQCVLIAVAQE